MEWRLQMKMNFNNREQDIEHEEIYNRILYGVGLLYGDPVPIQKMG